jgi:nicotinamidase-related amidase
MVHKNILQTEKAVLVIIDMQEAFRSSISDFAETAARIALMAHAAQLLHVPIIYTEQYPKGLGRTAPEIKAVLPASVQPIEKTSFSSCGQSSFIDGLKGRSQVLISGIETHICVNQTAHDLLESGYEVHVLSDCVSSRSDNNKKLGLEKMQASGALLTSTEMALFELLKDSTHEQFKSIQKLIK